MSKNKQLWLDLWRAMAQGWYLLVILRVFELNRLDLPFRESLLLYLKGGLWMVNGSFVAIVIGLAGAYWFAWMEGE